MKVAIDISPLSSGHKYRGTGFYVQHLKDALEKYFAKDNQFTFFTDKKGIPQDTQIVHYPYFDPFTFSLPLFPTIPTMMTVLDLKPIIFPKAFPGGVKGNMKWQMQKFALRHVSGIITDSDSAKHDIQEIVGIPDEKISVTYLAAGESFCRIKNQESRIKKMREKYHLPERFALYVGDVTWNKNLPRVVEAAIQAHIPLVMAGKALVNENFDLQNVWNADIVKVQRLAKDHNTIIRLGFVSDEDLVSLYNGATIFIMPSLYEGFGLPILEAMACGCPVITSSEGSLPEVAGSAAEMVDAYDTIAIANGIQKVWSSEKLQKELSIKGLAQAEKFSWEKTAKETIAAYEKVASR